MRVVNCPFCLGVMPEDDARPDERCCHDCAVADVWFQPAGFQTVFAVAVPALAKAVHVRAESAEAARQRVIDTIAVAAL